MKHIESIISQCLTNLKVWNHEAVHVSTVGLVCGRYVSVYKRQVPYRRVCTSRYFRQSLHAMMQLFPGRYFSTHVVARHLCSTQNSTLARWAKKGTGREMRRGYVPRRQKKMQAAISSFFTISCTRRILEQINEQLISSWRASETTMI